jgi:flagellum-specific ATP synthase
MKNITTPQHRAAALTIRQLLAAHSEHEDLLSIGAYRRGSNRAVDAAVDMRDAINGLLQQSIDGATPFVKVVEQLTAVAAQCQAKLTAPATPPLSTTAPAAAGAGMRVG